MPKKIVISFDVVEHEDNAAARRAINADSAYAALYDIGQILRLYDKYGADEAKTKAQIISEIQDGFHETLTEHNINLADDYL